MRRGYIQSYNLIIEHKLPYELVTSIGYVGSHLVRGFGFVNINAGQIEGAGLDGQSLYTKFGRTQDTNVWDGRYGSNYNSLQATINRRFTGSLFLKGSYTYSKAIGEVECSDWTGAEGGIWSALNQQHRNRADTAFNIPNILQMGFAYELPFGSEKKWATSGGARAILGGWQINGIFSSYQGRMFTLSSSGSSVDAPGNIQTPDQIKPDVAILGGLGDSPYFDTSAFARVTDVRYGNVGRNTMRGPVTTNLDFSVFRRFKVTEKMNMEFRCESFNFTNTPHFGNPNGNRNNSNFGNILSDVNDPRSFRFGLRLSF